MSMSKLTWVFGFVLLLAAFVYAYLSMSDLQMRRATEQQIQQQTIPPTKQLVPLTPPPCDHPSCRDRLTRT
jgi:preprotein translocase subunit SecG